MNRLPAIYCLSFALVALPFSCWANGQGRSSRVSLTKGYAPDGVLEPWKASDVACVEPGLLDKLLVKLGDPVQIGQPLAQIDGSALETQLAIIEAQAAAQGRLLAAEADVRLNWRRVAALQEARENRFSSQSELERAEADLRISEGRLKSELEEQEVMRLQVVRLKHQIKQRTITAPIQGIVTQVHKELGEFVSPTSPEVLRIIDVSRLRASFFLQVHELAELRVDSPVKVLLGDGQESQALVEHIAPVADGESGLVEVRVLIDNPELKILGSRCALLLNTPST